MSIDSGSSAGGGAERASSGEQGCQSASKSSVYPLEIAKLMREAFAAAWPQVRPINKNREVTRQLLASAMLDRVDTGARGKDEIVAAAVARVGVVHGDLAPQTVTRAHSRRIGASRPASRTAAYSQRLYRSGGLPSVRHRSATRGAGDLSARVRPRASEIHDGVIRFCPPHAVRKYLGIDLCSVRTIPRGKPGRANPYGRTVVSTEGLSNQPAR